MANFEAVTVCNGCTMLPGVQEYIEKFDIQGEDICAGVDNKMNFEFYGYCWPYISTKDKDDDVFDDVFYEFFTGLRKFVPKGKTLVIQMIGHVKCRFPMSALSITITPKGVKYVHF